MRRGKKQLCLTVKQRHTGITPQLVDGFQRDTSKRAGVFEIEHHRRFKTLHQGNQRRSGVRLKNRRPAGRALRRRIRHDQITSLFYALTVRTAPIETQPAHLQRRQTGLCQLRRHLKEQHLHHLTGHRIAPLPTVRPAIPLCLGSGGQKTFFDLPQHLAYADAV